MVINNQVLAEDLPYELVYNIACALIDDNKPILAAKALQQALQVGSRFLKEGDSSASEILHELAGVRTQAALLLQSSHYDEAALAIYAQISGTGKGKHHGSGAIDASTIAIANNNRVIVTIDNSTTSSNSSVPNKTVNHNRLLMETLKRVNNALTNADATKLTRRQILTLALNRCIILLQLRKIDECTNNLQEIRNLINQERTKFNNNANYLTILSQHADAVDIALRYQKTILSDGITKAVTVTNTTIKENVETSQKSSSFDVNAVVGTYIQNLISEGKFIDAAVLLENILKSSTYVNNPLPALAATISQLYFSNNITDDRVLKPIDTCVIFWSAQVKKNSGKIIDKLNSSHATNMLIQSLLIRAGIATQIKKYSNAATDYDTILKLPNISSEYKAAAYASLSTLRMQQASVTNIDDTNNRTRLVNEADSYLKEANTMANSLSTSTTTKVTSTASPSRPRRGSRVGVMDNNDETLLDQLEWTPPDQRKSTTSTATPASPRRDSSAPPSPRLSSPAVSSSTIPPLAADDTGKIAAKQDARRARIKRKRAIRREKYLEKLKASGKYFSHLPAPNPDRWIPRRERFRKKGKTTKGYTTGSGHQGGVDKRMESQLDVRARTEAEKLTSTTTTTTSTTKKTTTTTTTSSTQQPNPAVLAAVAAGAKKKGKGKR